MNLLHQLFNRETGIINNATTNRAAQRRAQTTQPSLRPTIPDSTWDALSLANYYRFENSFDSLDSPPLTLALAGDNLASSNDTGDVVILDSDSLQEKCKFKAHHCAVFDVKWRKYNSPNNTASQTPQHLLTASGDRSITLWDAECATEVEHFNSAHLGSVKTVAFYDENLFSSGGRDGAIKLWDLRASHSALKCGPVLVMEDPHLSRLPTVKMNRKSSFSSRVGGVGITRRHRSTVAANNTTSPIASSTVLRSKNFLPSNVVTCVQFSPSNPYHLYSSGIMDNAIKVWDIRRCRRQYACQQVLTPIKYHTIKHCSPALASPNHHGFGSFIFSNSTKRGVDLLLASATDHKIYAFLPDIVQPVMSFSGRFSNHFTRICTMQHYLLSGSTNGRAYVWNCSLDSLPNLPMPTSPLASSSTTSSSSTQSIVLPNRKPIYQLELSDDPAEISVVAADSAKYTVYNTNETQLLSRWTFFPTKLTDDEVDMDLGNFMPECKRYVAPRDSTTSLFTANITADEHQQPQPQPMSSTSQMRLSLSSSLPTPPSNNEHGLKRALTNENTPPVTTATASSASVTNGGASSGGSSKPPLRLITSWLYNTPQSAGGGTSGTMDTNANTKRLKASTSQDHSGGSSGSDDQNQNPNRPKTNNSKPSSLSRSSSRSSHTRRSLFCRMRKISDYFHTP